MVDVIGEQAEKFCVGSGGSIRLDACCPQVAVDVLCKCFPGKLPQVRFLLSKMSQRCLLRDSRSSRWRSTLRIFHLVLNTSYSFGHL